jgi:two-component system sensor kinase FixL
MNEWTGSSATRGNARLLIFASEAETPIIADVLSGTGSNHSAATPAELVDGIGTGEAAAAVVTAEALSEFDMPALKLALELQPAWSDFPFVLIAERGAIQDISHLLELLGQVILVERPIQPFILRNAAEAALRLRSRQREAEAYLLQRTTVEEHLRQLTGSLEARVRERMGDLRAANERLKSEVRERHAAEERLRESEELYRYTIELSRGIVWTAAPDGTFQNMTSGFWEATGMEPGTLPRHAMHPEDRGRVLSNWEEAIATGQPHFAEFRLRLRDGSYRQVRARSAPRKDEQGRVVRWYGLLEDIHEQKQAELAREEAEERYRLAARATNDAIWDFDVIGSRIRWTASESAFFGYRNNDEMSRLAWWGERIHPEDRKRVASSIDAAIAGSRTRWSQSYRFLKADGNYADVFDQGFIIRDQAGQAVRAVGAMADITQLRRAEAEIRRMQAELIHVSRLSAMGTMASTLAHELNQPLTAVSSYIRGSRRRLEHAGVPVPSEVHDALEAAENAALRAGQIVRRLRELVARGNVSSRPESLTKLIEDASLIAFLDEHLLGVTHRLDFSSEVGWVKADPIQIQQVVINLVRNAMQAMEDQPRREVVIRTSVVSKAMAEVSVADTGAGIPAEVREALFSPFVSTKTEGMGIGLSISRTIVEAHGGKIWAEDAPDGGTVFRFTLPRADAPSETTETGTEEAAA